MKNKTPFEVGVTGGIGSGKSLVCKIFSILGVPVYDADQRARWLTNNDPLIKKAISQKFGSRSYNENGLDRNYIASIVFKDPGQLQLINSIVHPAVGRDYDQWVTERMGHPYVIKEAAIMFESGAADRLHKVINISAPEQLRIQRVLKRDPFRSEKEVRSILSKQMSEAERMRRSDFVIYNDEQQMLIPQVLKLHEMLMGDLE